MTRNLAPLIRRGMREAERPEVIATVLINDKLTYANEANAGEGGEWREPKGAERPHGGILTRLRKHAEKHDDGTWDYAVAQQAVEFRKINGETTSGVIWERRIRREKRFL